MTTIQTFLTQLLGLGLLAPVTAVAGLVLSVAFAGRVAVVIAIAVPVLVVAAGAIIFAASRYSIRLRRKIDDINRLFLETLEGVRVIRAFNRQEHETARFGETNAETAKISRSATAMSGLMLPTVNLLFGLASVGAMAVGTALVMHGGMDVGALVAATQYITMILLSIIMMSQVVSLFPDAWACAGRIGEVLATEPSIRDPEKPTPPKTGRGTVEFRNVTFAYPGTDVLRSISPHPEAFEIAKAYTGVYAQFKKSIAAEDYIDPLSRNEHNAYTLFFAGVAMSGLDADERDRMVLVFGTQEAMKASNIMQALIQDGGMDQNVKTDLQETAQMMRQCSTYIAESISFDPDALAVNLTDDAITFETIPDDVAARYTALAQGLQE